jgi:diguanylate cyclase (GGDEF)-like protein
MVAVMFIDLDGFKAVNDKLGHQAGDELLKIVAERLRKGIRSNDLVARLGGDEFIVVLAELDQAESATRIAHTLTETIAIPISLCDTTARVSASIGISLFPTNGSTSEQLLGKADDAVYLAKSAGKNRYQWAAQD